MRIWKWKIDVIDRPTVTMPVGAKLLDAQMQGGSCCLWALCDQNARAELRHLAIYGTGNPMPDEPGEFVATFQMRGGALVFHLFDLGSKTL